jgi:hypothetical protein
MKEKYGIEGDASEADGRNFNQRHKGSSNNEDTIKLNQIILLKIEIKDSTRRNMK